MKQLLFLMALTMMGTVGTLAFNPFWGLAIYYCFAVLRPHFMWEWALRPLGGAHLFGWSFYIALCTILATVASEIGLMRYRSLDAEGKRLTDRFTVAHWFVLIFGVWISVTYVTAYDRNVAYPWFIEYMKIFTMFTVGALLLRSLRQIWLLLLLTAATISYIAYEINITYLTTRRITIYHGGYGGLDNNGIGLTLAMAIPMCLFIWEGTAKWWRWAFLLFIPPLLHAVLMSYSRGAMVSLLAVTPLVILRSSQRRLLLPGGALAALFLLPTLAGPEIRERFFSIQRYEKDDSARSRFSSWEAAWLMALDHPIIGVGVRNANLFSEQYGADMKGRTIHSQYLQILADNGFIGLGLYLTMLLFTWRSVQRARSAARQRTGSQAQQAYATACGIESSFAVFAIGGLFLSLEVFELPYLLVLLGAQLSVVLQQPEQETPASPPEPPPEEEGSARAIAVPDSL